MHPTLPYIIIALALSIYIRMKAYITCKSAVDQISVFPSTDDSTTELYYLPSNMFIMLQCIIVQIKRHISGWLDQSHLCKLINAQSNIYSSALSYKISHFDFMLKAKCLYYCNLYNAATNHLVNSVGEEVLSNPSLFINILEDRYGSKEVKNYLIDTCSILFMEWKMYTNLKTLDLFVNQPHNSYWSSKDVENGVPAS